MMSLFAIRFLDPYTIYKILLKYFFSICNQFLVVPYIEILITKMKELCLLTKQVKTHKTDEYYRFI